MREIEFRVWHKKEKKMYYRGYQKLLHVLLCEDDQGENQGKGTPVKRASYEDCELLESSGLKDIQGREVFEGDIVKLRAGTQIITGVVEPIPDMFRSRRLHPLHALLEAHGIPDNVENLEIEVVGHKYEKES